MAVMARNHWKEETTKLYEFAMRSADQIEVRNDEVIISRDSILDSIHRDADSSNKSTR